MSRTPLIRVIKFVLLDADDRPRAVSEAALSANDG